MKNSDSFSHQMTIDDLNPKIFRSVPLGKVSGFFPNILIMDKGNYHCYYVMAFQQLSSVHSYALLMAKKISIRDSFLLTCSFNV